MNLKVMIDFHLFFKFQQFVSCSNDFYVCFLHYVYTNRSICYIKLGKLAEGLADSEMSFKLCPRFLEGYFRKGDLEIFMKDFDSAI